MAKRLFAYKADHKEAGKAIGVSLPISFKQSIEVAAAIRNKPLKKAISLLERVKEMKEPIEYKRFNRGGTGHKRGKGPGRFPIKTSDEILKILRSAEANAINSGLNSELLNIESIIPQKASKSFHYGRQGRRLMKRTHIEVVLKEKASEKKKIVPKEPVKKATEPKKLAEVKKAPVQPASKPNSAESKKGTPSIIEPAAKTEPKKETSIETNLEAKK